MPERDATIEVAIRSEADIVQARQAGRDLARALGFSSLDQARITTTISELSRNIVLYAGHGKVSLVALPEGPDGPGLELRFDDEGPGIADLEAAMQQGFSTGSGLGAGLPGSQRLMDEFEVRSAAGFGVHIRARKWSRRRA